MASAKFIQDGAKGNLIRAELLQKESFGWGIIIMRAACAKMAAKQASIR